MKYRSFLFLFVLFFALVAVADIRMTGPEVTASATADPGRANVTSTESASYDLKVEAETETYGKGWVGVRASGSLDTGFQLNPSISIERVRFLLAFDELEFTTALARGTYTTYSSGSRTLTGRGHAAVSAGGGSLSFSGGSFGVGVGSGRISLDGSTITDTTSFTIGSSSSSGSGSGSSSGSSSGSGSGCSNNPSYNWCTDTGTCTTGSGPGVPGPQCGQNYCCCP
ncbi:MAG: hypothetical protein OXN27_25605 [Candidatus Poribacteria bacterium]|nr:hypothetical protein [Candidatus Poribacteria bacterium]